ncbi:hypothetical protein [Isachenkonia alkalipeptolytica]|uniref:Uncharacterized protein n=1 Tax=Isachenkonia alkalipeptolytica TaxID=2565777 RepID=A0AA43XLH7_9CLOT|nr:hypothetical protein [Isachenkonia alkalipeptolytica]NBG88085.1 hypothetical protein [Isachenkonia alkalipeptolytica]
MSLFVGPIHHWLFNKIKTFEKMEQEVIRWGEEKGLEGEALAREIYQKYGEPVGEASLEEIIDTDNIHGWLQEKISRAEIRQSALISEILKKDSEYIMELDKVFREEGDRVGKELARKSGQAKDTAPDLFEGLHDYLLEGMPCDRVTEVMKQEEAEVLWKTNQCLHEKYWEAVASDVKIFYRLRDSWSKGFIEAANPKFTFTRVEPMLQKIEPVED